MKRSLIAALVLSLAATAFAVPALAHGDHEGSFPMKAADFQQKIDARVQRARAHLEKRIADQKLNDDQARAARAQFDGVVAQVSAEVQKAVADGTVTADEAKAVRQVARGLHQGGGGHGHHRSAS